LLTYTSELIIKIKEKPTNISFHPNGKLFGISANGNLYEINAKKGKISLIYDFDGQYYNSLTISSNGIVYATGNKGILMSLDLSNGISTNHGNIEFEATGDLTFFQGEIYVAVTMDRIAHVDVNQPENNTVKIQGQTNGKIFGIVSFAESCNEIQTFTRQMEIPKFIKLTLKMAY
jgi:WD40 repeat protein